LLRLREVVSNPNAGHREYSALMLEFPQLSEGLKRSFDVFESGQKKAISSAITPAYAALSSGQPDMAIKSLEDRRIAAENSGNRELVQAINGGIDAIKSDPTQAKATLYYIGAGADDKWAETVSKFGVENRAEQKFPLEMGQARATLAETEEKVKTARSEAAIKAEEARTAPKAADLKIEKLAAEVGLTKEQARAAKASAAASYASASSATATAEQTRLKTQQLQAQVPGLEPEKRFELESKLRKEYADNTKEYQAVSEGYGRMRSAYSTGAGDIALVYAFAKMNDPLTGVREGEFATVKNSAGWPEKVRAQYNYVVGKGTLSDQQRKDLLAQAGQLHDVSLRKEQAVRKTLEPIAKGFGLETKNIFYGAAPEESALQDAKVVPPAKLISEADAIIKGR
jgi:hypothetical protein